MGNCPLMGRGLCKGHRSYGVKSDWQSDSVHRPRASELREVQMEGPRHCIREVGVLSGGGKVELQV